MSRYIDADAFAKKVYEVAYPVIHEINSQERGLTLIGIAQLLDAQPTADVVEVVRCKDCIHHKPFPFSDEHICDVFDWESEDKDFCSFAERRNDE